jgi:hypothetical protein
MERRAALVLTFLALALNSARGGVLESDFCRKDALSTPGAEVEAYARRRGGYCDGVVYQVNSGDGELPVIGVSVASIAGNPQSRAVSITTMPLPASPSGIAWPLHLQGVAKSPKVNYRLDAALFSGRPFAIGPDSAMSKVASRLRVEDVAWSAWSDSSEHGRTYVPVIMPSAAGGEVKLMVRPTIPVAYVVFSIENTSGGVVKPEASLRMENDPDRRAEPVTLVIPPGKPELVVVKVIAVGNSGVTQAVSVRLIRPGGSGR